MTRATDAQKGRPSDAVTFRLRGQEKTLADTISIYEVLHSYFKYCAFYFIAFGRLAIAVEATRCDIREWESRGLWKESI